MAERSYPYVREAGSDVTAGTTTDAEFSAMARVYARDGVVGSRAGMELRPYGDSSGLNVKLPAGSAFVGGHFYVNETLLTLPIAVGDAYPRIDSVILRSEYGSVNCAKAFVKKGIPSNSPVATALTQSASGVYEVLLGTVLVGANAPTVTSANVTDRRHFAGYRSYIRNDTDDSYFSVNGDGNLVYVVAGAAVLVWNAQGVLQTGKVPHTLVTVNGATGDIGSWIVANFASISHQHPQTDIIVNGGTDIGAYVNEQIQAASSTLSGSIVAERDSRLSEDANIRSEYRHKFNGVFPVSIINLSTYSQEINGTRRAMYVQSDGTYGVSTSSERYKTNIRDAETDDIDGFTAEQILSIAPKLYQYTARVAEVAAGDIDHAATEIGLIAEDLHDAGLWQFVVYAPDEDGNLIPESVHYEMFAVGVLVATRWLRRQMDEKYASLLARVKALENAS